MADTKRWSVTYTKHVRQKRKVYQDGFLEFQSSHRKVMLYDDSDKLLETRFVKKDDVIKCGEALAFEGYLVDIAEPCGGDRKPDVKNGKGLHEDHTSPSRKPIFRKGGGRMPKLSPSQKIIRDFKKKEISKLVSSPSYPNARSGSSVEWQVLYTHHITQKAKKFHDGFLKLVFHGSEGRQVMLYDANRMHLNSRFLKKDEIVSAGKSLAFDGHLVEIGESDADDCNLKPVPTPRNENSKIFRKNIMGSDQVRVKANKNGWEGCAPENPFSSMTQTPKATGTNPASEPRRAVDGILSSLRKPMIQKKADGLSYQMLETCVNEYAEECSPGTLNDSGRRSPYHDCSIEVLKEEVEVIVATMKSRPSDEEKELDSDCLGPTQSPVLIELNQNEQPERTSECPFAGTWTCTNPGEANHFNSGGLSETCEVEGTTSTLHQAASSSMSAATSSCSLNDKLYVEKKILTVVNEFPSFDLGF